MPTSGGPGQQAIPKPIRAMPPRYRYSDSGKLLTEKQLPDERRNNQQRQASRCFGDSG
jgi:hypothetical protein